jgi:dihydroorotate dehydrogenase
VHTLEHSLSPGCFVVPRNLYPVLRRLFFALEPERAHAFALSSLQAAHRLRLVRSNANSRSAIELMGLPFANRIGLAAGFDKNGRYIDAIGALGFGFIEVGTVTPRPQAGQTQPRLFRLPAHEALINRMGFPNEGSLAVAARLAQRKYRGVVGVNIGKNATTALPHAVDDYVSCFRTLAPHADYVAINVSSPNTPELRRLQEVEHLQPILEALQTEGARFTASYGRHVPLLAKVSPDLADDELTAVAHLLVRLRIDGVIATNTTISRPAEGRDTDERRVLDEQGGLSGRPLRELTLRAIRKLKTAADGQLTVIGVGGIAAASDAVAAVHAGADLLQVYTGLIYRGPALVDDLWASLGSLPPDIRRV